MPKIDKVLLARAMEDGAPENRYLLDRQTGEILFVSSKMSQADLLAFKDRVSKDPKRYVPIPKTPSLEKYRDMELFAAQVKDKKLQEKLILILRGGNPTRPFLDAIETNTQEKENWKKFKQARVARRIEIFLKENGLL
jgi:hypothetical protein